MKMNIIADAMKKAGIKTAMSMRIEIKAQWEAMKIEMEKKNKRQIDVVCYPCDVCGEETNGELYCSIGCHEHADWLIENF